MYCAGDYCFRCLGFVGWITLVALGFASCFVLGLVTDCWVVLIVGFCVMFSVGCKGGLLAACVVVYLVLLVALFC